MAQVLVQMPNLFTSFLQDEPPFNKHYNEVREQSEQAAISGCQLGSNTANAIRKCNFAFFAAIMAPEASKDRFRTICDWGNWIFPFDDLFDDGDLKTDYERARTMLDGLRASFGEDHVEKPSLPLLEFHAGIWQRIARSHLGGVQNRYQHAMEDYSCGVLAQVRMVGNGTVPTQSEVFCSRRKSICVKALFALVEYGHALELPQQLFKLPTIQALTKAAVDVILLHNDILSYQKEESEGVTHNVIAALRRHGLAAQSAIDRVASDTEHSVLCLLDALTQLPNEESPLGAAAKSYSTAVKDVVKANLYWSFATERFLNKQDMDAIRHGGPIRVLARPLFLRSP